MKEAGLLRGSYDFASNESLTPLKEIGTATSEISNR